MQGVQLIYARGHRINQVSKQIVSSWLFGVVHYSYVQIVVATNVSCPHSPPAGLVLAAPGRMQAVLITKKDIQLSHSKQ